MRGSTSKYCRNFFQTICTLPPVTMFGRVASLPAFSRAWRQFHLCARPASMQASDEPTVAVPYGSTSFGPFHNWCSHFTIRVSIAKTCGYMSWSM